MDEIAGLERMERRWQGQRGEYREVDGEPKFVGHAAVVNVETELWPGMKEMIAPGAFKDRLAIDPVMFNWEHEPRWLLSSTKNLTLRLAEDEVGLAVDADIVPTSYSSDVVELLRSHTLSEMSFAFWILKRHFEDLGDGGMLRVIEKVQLFDVSVVAAPAYPGTDAGVRRTGAEVGCRSFQEDLTAWNIENHQGASADPPASEGGEGLHRLSLARARLRLRG